jgi:hypothetical protein
LLIFAFLGIAFNSMLLDSRHLSQFMMDFMPCD